MSGSVEEVGAAGADAFERLLQVRSSDHQGTGGDNEEGAEAERDSWERSHRESSLLEGAGIASGQKFAEKVNRLMESLIELNQCEPITPW